MTTVSLPDPNLTTWERWSTWVSEQFLSGYVPPPENRWLEMGTVIVSCAPFNKQGLLDPNHYARWQDWAQALARINVSGV